MLLIVSTHCWRFGPIPPAPSINMTAAIFVDDPDLGSRNSPAMVAGLPSLPPVRNCCEVTVIVSNGITSTLCANAVPTAQARKRPTANPIEYIAGADDRAIWNSPHHLVVKSCSARQ